MLTIVLAVVFRTTKLRNNVFWADLKAWEQRFWADLKAWEQVPKASPSPILVF